MHPLNAPKQSLSGGWSKSGDLEQGNSLKDLSLQCNFPQATATVTGAEAAAEKIKELNERFTALIDKLKASLEMHDEERMVRLLAWKLEWDMMMREREASIVHHGAAKLAHESVVEQARVMIATRHEDAGELSLHRERLESTYREGFADIANALKALTTPTIIAESGPGRCPHGKLGIEPCAACPDWGDA